MVLDAIDWPSDSAPDAEKYLFPESQMVSKGETVESASYGQRFPGDFRTLSLLQLRVLRLGLLQDGDVGSASFHNLKKYS